MNLTFNNDLYSDFHKIFIPKSPASKVLIPLLDALNWQGDHSKIIESLSSDFEDMDIDALMETMANLNFEHVKIGPINGTEIDQRILPILYKDASSLYLIISRDDQFALIYDTSQSIYINKELKSLNGQAYGFRHAEDKKDSLMHQQKNWFNKLMFRFKGSLKLIALITFFITLFDLLIPFFIIILYAQISSISGYSTLIITYLGVILYIGSSTVLRLLRSRIINYVSTRMGTIISLQTFTRLLYLSPAYTETASISAQINRIKDFENLKRFITSGVFINLLELMFSIIYIIAIFYIGGWIGFIPIITLMVIVLLGHLLRPFHKIKLEKRLESSSDRQQNLIELIKNTDEIKISGQKQFWFQRYKKLVSENIMDSYQLGNYVSNSNTLSYFLTNVSVLWVIYGGVLQVFNGRMNIGALIGVILLYWKVLRSIRGAFSLSVQINGLQKSIAQINRFMKLPQDSDIQSDMASRKKVQGKIDFNEVSIRYTKSSKPALSNVSFSAIPGQIIGLSGHDGAGKTTVLKLILAMYSPNSGRILVDNINIKQLEPLSLRRSISYSPDKDILLNGTIRANFKYFNPSITDESIDSLMKKTGLNKYMNYFNYTLDTELTNTIIENSSHAFKKLFSLTRMLSRDVQLYLIDEPENYLSHDEITRLTEVITTLAKSRKATVIISTKNNHLMNICDDVVNLNQGRLVKAKKNKAKKGAQYEEATV